MTPLEILEESIQYYETHNRAVDKDGWGVYMTDSGDMCIVGRCLELPEFYKGDSRPVTEIATIGLDSILKTQYRGQPLNFWRRLQGFHDSRENWQSKENGSGNILTPEGIKNLNILKQLFS